jgi:hypothetical protein
VCRLSASARKTSIRHSAPNSFRSSRSCTVIQTAHNKQNTYNSGEGSLPPRKRRANGAAAAAQLRGVARAWPWPVVGNRAGAIRMEGSEQMRAGKPWHTTGQGPRTHVSESPGKPKLGRANNLQNNTQNTHSVRAGTPSGTPSRTDRIPFDSFGHCHRQADLSGRVSRRCFLVRL